MNKSILGPALLFILGLVSVPLCAGHLRAPSVPLVACDPYFSIWSSADRLTDADTVHWTGKPHRLASLITIDDTRYRVTGSQPSEVPPLPQKSVTVLPTRTIYTFEGGGIRLSLTFMTPALPDDMELLSRPVTYVTWSVQTIDDKTHDVNIDFTASGELAVNNPSEQVDGVMEELQGLTAIKIGSTNQAVLAKSGDDIRIDWGYLYVAAPTGIDGTTASLIAPEGDLPVAGEAVAASITFDAIKATDQPTTRWLILAYDDLYSIQYMKQNLRPYWRRDGWEAADLLQASAKEYETLTTRCRAFDNVLMADLTRAGGKNYAALCALAFRQCFAAGKFVADDNGQPLQFCKENHLSLIHI